MAQAELLVQLMNNIACIAMLTTCELPHLKLKKIIAIIARSSLPATSGNTYYICTTPNHCLFSYVLPFGPVWYYFTFTFKPLLKKSTVPNKWK